MNENILSVKVNKKLTEGQVSEIVSNEFFELTKKDKNYLRARYGLVARDLVKLTRQVYENIIKEEKMAHSAKIEDVTIKAFDGTNYSSWKFRLKMVLEYKDCLEPVENNTRPTAIENEAWKSKSLKAKVIISTSVTDSQLEYIKNCTTPYQMISTFDQMHAAQSTPMQIVYRSKLDELRLNNFKNQDEFFLKFEQLCNKYTAAGGTLSDQEKVRYMTKALPVEYSQVGLLIDLVPEERKNVEFIKKKKETWRLSK